MERVRSFSMWIVAVAVVLVLAACVPSPARVVDRAVDRAVRTAVDAVVDRIVTDAVDRIVDRMFASMFERAFGAVSVRYGPDFDLDIASGSYELEISGDAPLRGAFRGEPVPEGEDPDVANLAFGLRGEDEDGARFVSVSLIQSESPAREFAVVLVDAEETADGEGGQVASVFFGDDDDDAYSGTFEWVLSTDTPSRLAGTFEARGLTTESGLGPVDVTGSFDVSINRAGSLLIMRQAGSDD